MSNTVYETIVQLPAGTQPLSGQEAVEVVQNNQSVQVTTGAIAALGGGGGGGGGAGVIVPPLTAHGVLIGEGIAPVNVTAPGNAGQVLTSNGASNDPSFASLPTIGPAGGGTGATSLAAHGVVVGEGTAPVSVVVPGAAGQALASNGPGSNPSFQTLPVGGGGTGATSLLAHGVVIGEGTSAVNVVTPGTAGFVLTSNGTNADPSFQVAGSSSGPPFPPSAAPDFQTYVQSCWTAGTPCYWYWGNVALNNPVVITMNASRNSTYVSLGGATVSPGPSYPVNTAVDMVTWTIPDSAPSNTNIAGFYLLEGTFIGVNPSQVQCVRNCVALACQLNVSGIYGVYIAGNSFIAGARSGLLLYGSVFEATLVGNFARDNSFAGIEMENPASDGDGNPGIISSIKFFGGDYRTNGTGGGGNGYGIASTSAVAFQEAVGFKIYGGDFINNASAGVYAPVGCQLLHGLHMENNCDNNAGETAGQIYVAAGGGVNMYDVDSAFITSNPGIYALEINGASGAFAVIYGHCSSLNESVDTPGPIGHLLGAGGAWIENFDDPTHYVGVGGWSVNKLSVTTTTV